VVLSRRVSCVDCHFFAKTSCVSAAARDTSVISESERALSRKGDFSWVREIDALWCYRGVWDEGRGSDRAARPAIVNERRPKASCVFTPFRVGLSLPGATDLSKTKTEAAQARHARRSAWIGAALTLVAIVVAYLVAAASEEWWPF
jgi:hypothetical protein